MAEKDITEKILLSYPDVFADIVNALLFNGEQLIHPDDLVDQAPRAVYKADGKIREVERDVAKRWMKNDIRIACIGMENQSEPDSYMPLRVFEYDGGEYRTQLLKENIGKPLYPVVTLVLYYGYKEHWNKPLRLHDAIDIPDFFKPYVSDIKINLFEIAYLTDEQLNCFHSDFKIVADYFVQMQRRGDYIPSHEQLQHVEAVLQLLSVMTNDHRFEDAINWSEGSDRGGVNNMCEVLDRIEARGAIKEAIRLYQDELNLSPADIIKKVMIRFSLDEKTAADYVTETLELQLV